MAGLPGVALLRASWGGPLALSAGSGWWPGGVAFHRTAGTAASLALGWAPLHFTSDVHTGCADNFRMLKWSTCWNGMLCIGKRREETSWIEATGSGPLAAGVSPRRSTRKAVQKAVQLEL